MSSKLHLKLLLKGQRIAARKAIASYESRIFDATDPDKKRYFALIKNEKDFLNKDLSKISNIRGMISEIHDLRHKDISKLGNYMDCAECKKSMAELGIELPGAPAENEAEPEEDLRPRFGNLMAVLEQEVNDEKQKVESRRMPSQNDITRWALKDAVLSYYQGLNVPEDFVVVDTMYDDRLITKLAPDFDVIYNIWLQKLDELRRRNDKFALESDEYDKAENDTADGMRGSAFEKQLDRYREEFMKKLMR